MVDRRVGCDGQVIQVAAADGMAATVRTEVSALVVPRACAAILRNGQRCADSELLGDGEKNLVAFVRETPQRAQPSSQGNQVPQGEVLWAFVREIHAAARWRAGRIMVGVRVVRLCRKEMLKRPRQVNLLQIALLQVRRVAGAQNQHTR